MTGKSVLPFEVWKERLLEDFQRHNKLLPHGSLGEECLKILWEFGTEPTVQGIVDSSE